MRDTRRNALRSVKIFKNELLTIVRENKVKHIADYQEAVEDYKAAVLKIAKDNLQLAESGDLEKISKIKSTPHAPVSYEDNYNRAIRMLELSVDVEIELEQDVFNQLVLDEWSWKNSFLNSKTLYKSI